MKVGGAFTLKDEITEVKNFSRCAAMLITLGDFKAELDLAS
jgi:hypothetical protein